MSKYAMWVASFVLALTPTHHHRMHKATASWYYDGGSHCCGVYSYFGVATCGDQTPICFRQGTKILFAYHGRRVKAIVDDHGPYANGAAWDLNQNVRAALHFDGVDTVSWRIVH